MRTRTLAALTVVAAAAGCSGITGPAAGPSASLSFSTRPATSPLGAPGLALYANGADTIAQGTDTLIVTRAQLVLRKVELKTQDSVRCSTEHCEEFEAGPIAVDLPLGAGAQQQVAVNVPPGTYNGIEFNIHRVGGDSADSTFIAAHPDLSGVSIKVDGTFNGTAFTFTSQAEIEQELAITPPLVVSDTTTATNLTIQVALAGWFVDRTGGLIDPSTANRAGANESIVTANIEQSAHVFEDDNHDGVCDHPDSNSAGTTH